MFWFPKPGVIDSSVTATLEAERQYLLGPWPPWKVAVGLLVPGMLAALALAFWRRSWLWAALVVNVIAVSKVAWTAMVFETGSFLAHLTPAVTGLLICNAVLWLLYQRYGHSPQ